MKKFFPFVLFLALLTILAACGSDSKDGGEKVKIAGIFSASGGAAALGEPEMETVKLLVEQQNKDGGIDGKQIELITYDDKSDQNEAILAMKKAITQEKVSLVIGGTISGNSLAMLPLAEQHKVPYISVAASKQIYDDEGKSREWVFKIPQDDQQAVERILKYLQDEGLTNVAWLNVYNSFGTSAHDEYKEFASKYGINTVLEDEFDAHVTDAKPLLTRVKKANPDAIIVWGTVQETAVVVQNIRELDLKMPVLASHGVATAQFLETAGDAANGVILPTGKILVRDGLEDSNPQKALLEAYSSQYKEKYKKEAGTFGAYAADAFHIAVKAIEAKGTDGAAIRDYIENEMGSYVGLTGEFNITKDDHMGLKPDSFALVQIKDGNWDLID